MTGRVSNETSLEACADPSTRARPYRATRHPRLTPHRICAREATLRRADLCAVCVVRETGGVVPTPTVPGASRATEQLAQRQRSAAGVSASQCRLQSYIGHQSQKGRGVKENWRKGGVLQYSRLSGEAWTSPEFLSALQTRPGRQPSSLV